MLAHQTEHTALQQTPVLFILVPSPFWVQTRPEEPHHMRTNPASRALCPVPLTLQGPRTVPTLRFQQSHGANSWCVESGIAQVWYSPRSPQVGPRAAALPHWATAHTRIAGEPQLSFCETGKAFLRVFTAPSLSASQGQYAFMEAIQAISIPF